MSECCCVIPELVERGLRALFGCDESEHACFLDFVREIRFDEHGTEREDIDLIVLECEAVREVVVEGFGCGVEFEEREWDCACQRG